RLGALAQNEHVQRAHDPTLPWLFDGSAKDGDATVYVRRLDPRRDVGLDHHRIDGVPVLPGVVGVEMMVQAAEHATQQTACALCDVRFAAPLKLHRDEPLDARVEVRVNAGEARVTLVSLFVGPGGKEMRREHFFARVLFAGGAKLTRPAPWTLELAREPNVSRAEIYRRYFHGPTFQVLDKIETVGENGVSARPLAGAPAWLSEQALWRTDPVCREAAFQAAGVWEMTELGRMSLPSAIARVDLVGVAPASGLLLTIEVRKRHAGPEGGVFDAWVRDENGRVYDVMHGYRTATLRDLGPAERFEPTPPHQGPPPRFLTLDLLEVGEMLAAGAAEVVPHYLSAAEQTRFGELKTDKRRLEYLAGRVVAKRLIRQARYAGEGAIVPYSAITILADVLGAPEVQIVGEPAGPLVSIAHGAGVAAAYLSGGPGLRPGIDVEKIERRDPSFAATYFTPEEQAQAQADPDRRLTAMWAVKEAMVKALGVGARVDLRELVTDERDGTWHVTLSGQAREVAEALGVVETSIEVEHDRERVFARVQLASKNRLPLGTAAKTPREVLA
ncbi:MAG: polyketide synthase dehydratase domain-containing protein, partial [Deltaproteobacteria bacterium]|nr:polyketide synthase dehydratase domain-containing protein [Deltaproteobacteria bacterium]